MHYFHLQSDKPWYNCYIIVYYECTECSIYLLTKVCRELQNGARRIWNQESRVPYIVKGDVWVGYDDTESIKEKVCLQHLSTHLLDNNRKLFRACTVSLELSLLAHTDEQLMDISGDTSLQEDS